MSGEEDEDERTPLLTSGDPEQEKPVIGCCGKLRSWLGSIYFYVYCSHTLSAWGDRMWQFAVGLFLVNLTGNSLQLTAIYGFSSGGSVLLFGALIGDWVDRNPRLRVARTTLVVQNLCIVICAVILCMMLIYPEAMTTVWDGWLNTVCQVLVILFADLAFLASTGNTIAIERDWVVEICGRDTKSLTRMTAVLRRIDLTTNILAPVGVGQIMTYGSLFIGAVFIASWNFVSFFFEYYLLWKVHEQVPALAVKKMPKGENENGDVRTTSVDLTAVKEPKCKCPNFCYKMFGSFITVYKGWKCYMNQSITFAGLALACLYMTVLGFDNITTGYAYSQGMSESVLGAMMALGAGMGILGTFGFQFFRGKVGLVRTGLFSLMLEVSCLSMCVASIWAPGSPFDPFLQNQPPKSMSLNCTNEIPTMMLRHPGYYSNDHATFADFTKAEQSLKFPFVGISDSSMFNRSSPMSLGATHGGLTVNEVRAAEVLNYTCVNSTSTEVPVRNYVSLALLMTGIITARFGLWSADLTITQLIMESVEETERGTVNGVQSSLNMFMDMIKFAMVIVAPDPPTFGILIMISFAFILVGILLYTIYLRKARGHLFHFEEYFGDVQFWRMPGTLEYHDAF